jgi:hypothetical protein
MFFDHPACGRSGRNRGFLYRFVGLTRRYHRPTKDSNSNVSDVRPRECNGPTPLNFLTPETVGDSPLLIYDCPRNHPRGPSAAATRV